MDDPTSPSRHDNEKSRSHSILSPLNQEDVPNSTTSAPSETHVECVAAEPYPSDVKFATIMVAVCLTFTLIGLVRSLKQRFSPD